MLRWCFIVSLALAGCALDFDAVGPVGGAPQGAAASGGSDSGGETASGGGTICDADNGACVELPPGFDAIVELRGGDGCTGASLFDGTLTGGVVVAPDAQCGCKCRFEPTTCGAAEIWSNGSCLADGGDITLEAGLCTGVSDIQTYKVTVGSLTGALCESDGGEGPLPTRFTFDAPASVCAIDDQIGCKGGACLPADGARYCVRATTAASCSGETFTVPEIFLAEEDFDDTRTCSCQCSGPDGAVQCDQPTMSVYTSNNCSTLITTAVVNEGCHHTGQGAGGLILAPVIDGECNLAEPLVTGGVSAPPGAGTLLCCTN